MTRDESTVKARRLPDGSWLQIHDDGSQTPLATLPSDWAGIDAMTDEDVEYNALLDPDEAPYLTESDRQKIKTLPVAKTIREKLKLTQLEFAERYEIPLGTLRDWERGARFPDSAARAYLRVIDQDPEGISKLLARSAVDSACLIRYAAPDVGHAVAFGERVCGIEDVLGETGDPALATDLGDDGVVWTDLRFANKLANKGRAKNRLVDELAVESEFALGVEHSHTRAGAGSTGRSIQSSRPGGRILPVKVAGGNDDRIATVRVRTDRRASEHGDGRTGQRWILGMDGSDTAPGSRP